MFAVRRCIATSKAARNRAYKVRGCGRQKSGGFDCGSGGDDKKPPRHLRPECNPSAPTVYDCRKYGHNLPCDSVMPYFETLPYFPTGIFRCTAGEVLGLGANKCGYYKNPEYFSFHHMSFYDIHMLLRCYRQPSPKTGRKK
ncbi:uncharacterized protein LOC112055511 [Bicyclus anynana]|uniref:Uncharacterized protein LOC112055511 n=1 Tax=Bicyclus anynana TaxID=110368 RepID=A0A6J1P232_BICAN|nr:uncharacterized protein LOC112055511 [Bicyclus anynana]